MSCFIPIKHEKPLIYKDFKGLVKFGYAKWNYASHSDVAPYGRSDVMCSVSRAEGTLHMRSALHFRRILHVPLAEHIVEKRRLLS